MKKKKNLMKSCKEFYNLSHMVNESLNKKKPPLREMINEELKKQLKRHYAISIRCRK